MSEREVKDLFFKQLRKVAIGSLAVPDDARVSLLAASSRHGLTFLATSTGVGVFETEILASVDKALAGGSKNAFADLGSLQAMQFSTPAPPLHLSLSSDTLTLCLAWRVNNILSLNFYDTRAIVQASSPPVQPFCSISPATQPGTGVCGVQWNTGSPELLAVVLSSGGLYVLEVKEDVKVVASQAEMGATCLCWSPKGKQLALGLRDGSIVQYSHKTCAVKQCHPCPDAFGGVPQQVTDVHWVSTYMFAAVYTPTSGSDHSPTSLLLSTPKNNPVTWCNWGDVYYGGNSRADKFYFIHLSPWNILLTSSGNALETVVFSQLPGDGGWERWELEDDGRAEVPLADGEETHVVGMDLSMCSQSNVQISDTVIVPPSPLLLLYTTAGVLCPFWVIHRGKSPEDLAAAMTPLTPLPPGPPRVPTCTPASMAQSSATVATARPDAGTQFSTVAILGATTASTGCLQIPATPALPHSMATPTFSGPSGSWQALSSTAATVAALQLPKYRPPLQTAHPPPPTVGAPLQTARPPPPTVGAPLQTAHPPSHTVGVPLQTAHPPSHTIGVPLQTAHPPSHTIGVPLQTAHPPSLTIGVPLQTTRPPLRAVGAPLQTVHPPPPTVEAPLQTAHPPSLTIGVPLQTARPPLRAVEAPLQTAHPPSHTVGVPLQTARPPLSTAVVPLQTVYPPPTVGAQLPAIAATLQFSRPSPPVSGPPQQTTFQSFPTGIPPGITVRPLHTTPQQQVLARPAVTSGMPPASIVGPHQTTQRPPLASCGLSSGPPPPTQPLARPSLSQPVSQLLQGSTSSASSAGPRVGVASSQPPVSGAAVAAQPQTTTARGPPSRDDAQKVEASFSAYIAEEIDRFADELEVFKEDMESVLGVGWEEEEEEEGGRSVGGLGTLQDAVEVREETDEVGSGVWEAVNTVKELTNNCDQLRDEVLRGLELCEKARVSVKKTSGREYAVRQKVRLLDPANLRKLHDIRKLFLEVDQKIGEVNGHLDAEKQRRRMDSLQRGRSPLRPPSIQTVYSSLRDHGKILRRQEERAAGIAREMKRLRFIPQSWTPEDAQQTTWVTPSKQRGWDGGGGQGGQEHAPHPEKLDKLWEYLRNIEEIPVCRARPKAFVRPLSDSSSGKTTPVTNPEHSQDTADSYIESGRASSDGSHHEFLISGSKPRLHRKTADGYECVASLISTPQASAQTSSISLTQEVAARPPQPTQTVPQPPLTNPSVSSPKPLLPSEHITQHVPQHPPPPRAASSGDIGHSHTVAWGGPPTCSASLSAVNVGVASHEGTGALRRVEGQANLTTPYAASLQHSSLLQNGAVRPAAISSHIALPFSLSYLSSTLSQPPLSGPVLDHAGKVPSGLVSGLTTYAGQLAVPPSSSEPGGVVFFGKSSGGHTGSVTPGSIFTFGSSAPLSNVQVSGTATKLVTSASPPLSGFPASSSAVPKLSAVTTAPPLMHSSPFVFGVTASQSIVVTSRPPAISAQPQRLGGRESSASPPTTEAGNGRLREKPILSGVVHSAPSITGPSFLPTTSFSPSTTATSHTDAALTSHGDSSSSVVGPSHTFQTSSLQASLTSSSLPTSRVTPPLAVVMSTAAPVTAVTTTTAPVAAVTTTTAPVVAVTSTTAPVVAVTTTTAPVAAVTSTASPVAVVMSTAAPVTAVTTTTATTAPVAAVTSTTAPVAAVTSTAPLPVAPIVCTSTSMSSTASPVSTGVVSVTATSVSFMKPSASVPATSMTAQALGSVAGAEEQEMEDDMEQADAGLQLMPAVSTAVGGAGLFGGLGGLGLGGPSRNSSSNPFGSFTPVAPGMASTSAASQFLSGGILRPPSGEGLGSGAVGVGSLGGGGVGRGGTSLQSRPTFSLTNSQPQFGQSPRFGQSSMFGGAGGTSLGGGPPSFNTSSFSGMFGSNVAGTARTESLSFGTLANQRHTGFVGQGSGFSTGSGFGNPPMTGSSFSGWRQ